MGWIEKITPDHVCDCPEVGDYPYTAGLGSRWQCDECKKIYVLRDWYGRSAYWQSEESIAENAKQKAKWDQEQLEREAAEVRPTFKKRWWNK